MVDCLPPQVVDAQLVDWRARDAAAFAEHYAPDAVIVFGPGEDDTVTGRDAIRDYYANGFTEMPTSVELTIGNRIVSGEYVVDQEVFGDETGSGEVVAIYRVQSCLISRVEFLPFVSNAEGAAQ